MSDIASICPDRPACTPVPSQEPLSRRSVVIGAAGLAVVVGAVGPRALTLATPPSAESASGLWTREFSTLEGAGLEEWMREVGSTFTVVAENGRTVAMKLGAVQAFPTRGARPSKLGRAGAFDALFDPADRNAVKGNRIYRVRHARYGEMNIFLTRTVKGRLEAVFN